MHRIAEYRKGKGRKYGETNVARETSIAHQEVEQGDADTRYKVKP